MVNKKKNNLTDWTKSLLSQHLVGEVHIGIRKRYLQNNTAVSTYKYQKVIHVFTKYT